MWQELLKTAILGTDRSELPQWVKAQLQRDGLDTEVVDGRLLLEAATYYRQLRKAAFEPSTYAGVLPAPAEEEAGPACSARSIHHLQLILEGCFEDSLEEFIALMNRSGKHLPPEYLPELLSRAAADRSFWVRIRSVIGNRGRWLIRQNPEWAALLPPEGPALWRTGKRAERLGLFSRMRQQDPVRAVEWLTETWEAASYADKVALMERMNSGLDYATDGPLLERALEDSRKEVRLAAADLLGRLPESEMVQTLSRRAGKGLVLDAQGQLQIDPPEKLDATLRHYGIGRQQKNVGALRKRVGWLCEMIACVSPNFWTEQFDRSPEAILKLIGGAHWKAELLQALSRAVIRQPDERWMAAIVNYWFEADDKPLWDNATGRQLVASLPNDLFNQLAAEELERRGGLVENGGILDFLLRPGQHWWSDELTLAFVNGFQHWMTRVSDYFWNTYHYKKLLRVAGFRCDPRVLPRLGKGWNFHSRIWMRWEEDVEQMLRIVRFRREMREGLEGEG